MLRIICKRGEVIEADRRLVGMSNFLKNLFEDRNDAMNEDIPLNLFQRSQVEQLLGLCHLIDF